MELRENIVYTPHKIVQIPDGSEPEEVRKAWLGLEMPASRYFSSEDQEFDAGTLEPTSRRYGYVSPLEGSLQVLSQGSPDAARWYIQNLPEDADAFTFGQHELEPVTNPHPASP